MQLPRRKNAVQDDTETESQTVPSTEVARPLTAREIRKNEALSDTVRYAKRYHIGVRASFAFGVTAALFILWSIWAEELAGDLFWTGVFFGFVAAGTAMLTGWCHDLWKEAMKVYLSDGSRNANMYRDKRYSY